MGQIMLPLRESSTTKLLYLLKVSATWIEIQSAGLQDKY